MIIINSIISKLAKRHKSKIYLIFFVLFLIGMRYLSVQSSDMKADLLISYKAIVDNLIAAGAALLIGSFFRDSLWELFTIRDSAKVIPFKNISEMIELLSNELKTRKLDDFDNLNRAILLFSSPVINFSGYVSYLGHMDVGVLGEGLSRVDMFLRSLICHGRGAFDSTIMGYTGIPEIDRTNTQFVKETYLKSEFPKASFLGFHENLNEVGSIVIYSSRRRDVQEFGDPIFMMQFVFSSDFKSIHGFFSRDKSIINQYGDFHSMKKKDILEQNFLYFENKSADSTANNEAYQTFKSTFLTKHHGN